MAEPSLTFRDFGILPEGLPEPPPRVEAFFSTGQVIGQYIFTGIVSALGLGLVVVFALFVPLPLNLLACAAAVAGFGAVLFRATRNDYGRVVLEGDTLRCTHLYTGRVLERRLSDIENLGTLFLAVGGLQTAVIEGLFGRVKGVVIRFRDGRTPLSIMRADPAMTNAKELIEAILYRMSRIRELDAQIINLDGQPMVRCIHWKGEPPAPRASDASIIVTCMMFLAGMFGSILAFLGGIEQSTRALVSAPPNAITAAGLIADGPGATRHLTITGFEPGGYVIETDKAGAWREVWVALFPAGAERAEINLVLSTKSVRDVEGLRRLLAGGRVTVLSEAAPSTGWAKVGPNLVQANNGCQLSSAWRVQEVGDIPSASTVAWIMAGSAACLALVLAFAAALVWYVA
jgi:hypothetical protein